MRGLVIHRRAALPLEAGSLAGVVPDLLLAVRRVGEIVVPLPRYQTRGASGMDLHAAIATPVTLASLGRVKIPTGLSIAIPDKFEGQVRPRSGLAARTGVTVLNAPGTIDADYRGEVLVLLVNLSADPVTISPLERIAQLVIVPIARAELVEEESLPETDRGTGGYGSTGA
jgi:dUTP pyrophosphatase